MRFKHLSRLTSNYLSKRIIFTLDMVLSLFATLVVILVFNFLVSANLFAKCIRGRGRFGPPWADPCAPFPA